MLAAITAQFGARILSEIAELVAAAFIVETIADWVSETTEAAEKFERMAAKLGIGVEQVQSEGVSAPRRAQAPPNNDRTMMAQAQRSHADIYQTSLRMKADALAIEHQAACRLADEYDAAQERGEVAANGQRSPAILTENSSPRATATAHGTIESSRVPSASRYFSALARRAIRFPGRQHSQEWPDRSDYASRR